MPVIRLPRAGSAPAGSAENAGHEVEAAVGENPEVGGASAALPTESATVPAPPPPSSNESASGGGAGGSSCSSRIIVTGEESSFLTQLARDHLQCPVCLDVLRTKPIYQCKNGHCICNTCIPHLHNCPMCRVCILGTKVRNMALESLLDHLQISCPFKNRGCHKMVKSGDMKKHMIECDFGKFILCPSLGFDTCQEPVSSENWKVHVSQAHTFHVAGGRSSNLVISYWDFLSTKTLKDGSLLKWQPVVFNAFPDTGPFVIHLELDTLKDCTATFSCVYAPPVLHGAGNNAENSTEMWDEEMQKKYFVQITLGEQRYHENSWVPKLKWRGESMLHHEYIRGSAKGTFKVPLGHLVGSMTGPDPDLPSQAPPANATLGGDLSALGAAALPPFRQPLQNNLRAANTIPPQTARRRPPVNEKRDMKVIFRFAKTQEDLDLPPANPPVYDWLSMANPTVVKPVSFPRVKCSECNEGPLRGIRYKCLECPKFDLCYKCMNWRDVHSHHIFMCIQTTAQNARMTKNFKRIFKEGPAEDEAVPQENSEVPVLPPKRQRKATTARNSTSGNAAAAPTAASTSSAVQTPPRGEGNATARPASVIEL